MIGDKESNVKFGAARIITLVIIIAFLGNPLAADIIAANARAGAAEKDYFALDSRRAKVAGQQEDEFKEEKPMPVPEILGFVLLLGVVVGVGMFAHNN